MHGLLAFWLLLFAFPLSLRSSWWVQMSWSGNWCLFTGCCFVDWLVIRDCLLLHPVYLLLQWGTIYSVHFVWMQCSTHFPSIWAHFD